MHISAIKQSKFLARADVNPPILVIIKSIGQENVAKEDQAEEMRFILHFTNCQKPLVLNTTNAQIIAKIIGSEETDDWAGKQIVLYDDPNVSFGGKLVGGIRVRAPRIKSPGAVQGVKPPIAPVAPVEELEPDPTEIDDVPF